MKCAYCFSTRLHIIGSDETREVVTVQCLDCGKHSQLDTENYLELQISRPSIVRSS